MHLYNLRDNRQVLAGLLFNVWLLASCQSWKKEDSMDSSRAEHSREEDQRSIKPSLIGYDKQENKENTAYFDQSIQALQDKLSGTYLGIPCLKASVSPQEFYQLLEALKNNFLEQKVSQEVFQSGMKDLEAYLVIHRYQPAYLEALALVRDSKVVGHSRLTQASKKRKTKKRKTKKVVEKLEEGFAASISRTEQIKDLLSSAGGYIIQNPGKVFLGALAVQAPIVAAISTSRPQTGLDTLVPSIQRLPTPTSGLPYVLPKKPDLAERTPSPHILRADYPAKNKRVVGEEFQISMDNSAQTSPSVTGLNDGNFVVTWVSDGQDGSGRGVYGQIFTASGAKVGSEFRVNTYTNSSQESSSVTGLSNGNFVVTWSSNGQDGSGYGVYGQVFTASGAQVGSEFLVNTYTNNDQGPSSVTGLNNGNFVVTWVNVGQDGSGWGISGQIFTASGAKVGSEFRVNTYTNSDQGFSSVTGLSNGNFVVTWESYGQDGSGYGVYGQVFTASGAKVGSEFQVNTYTNTSQESSSVTGLSNGNFVVTWVSYVQDSSNAGVYGQIFTASGAQVGSEFRVNTYTNSDQTSPSVTSLSNGNFLVTWQSLGQDGSGYGVYGQVFTASGAKVGSEFRVNTYTGGDQASPSVTGLNDGNFLVTWQSEGQDVPYEAIYGIIMDPHLTATNTNQVIDYQEDTPTSLIPIVITPPSFMNINEVTVDLALSDPHVGQLATASSGNVTATYNNSTGVWHAEGLVDDVNHLLAAVQFIPAPHAYRDLTIGVQINNAFNSPIADTITLHGISVNDIPELMNNQLDIKQGGSVELTSANLNATDIETPRGELQFIISNIQHGQFEHKTAPNVPIFEFNQQAIIYSHILFVHDGSVNAPAYSVRVSDGSNESAPSAATINFTPNAAPVLEKNQLTISQGDRVEVTSADLSATDIETPEGALQFTISNIQHGQFEHKTAPNVPIFEFSQQAIIEENILFVHDGSVNAPAYNVRVKDKFNTSGPSAATINFTLSNTTSSPTTGIIVSDTNKSKDEEGGLDATGWVGLIGGILGASAAITASGCWLVGKRQAIKSLWRQTKCRC